MKSDDEKYLLTDNFIIKYCLCPSISSKEAEAIKQKLIELLAEDLLEYWRVEYKRVVKEQNTS